jgi:pyridoxine 5-phosphate synthase
MWEEELMTKLSVNLNKVALLRNQRDCGYPSVLGTAKAVIAAGADGITVHPRPDERHIRKSDVYELAEFLTTQPDIEFNIEGYPTPEFVDMVCAVICHQVTLVPDAPDQKTSDHGWDIAKHKDFLSGVVAQINAAGPRVSLFIDPDPSVAKLAADIRAGRVELYTGPYYEKKIPVSQYRVTADAAMSCGLAVNAGHDLNLDNLAQFIQAIPACAEVSIGHAIIADALIMGWDATIKAYLNACKTMV